MLRLKKTNESPAGGFFYLDPGTGWRTHGWSFNGVVASWYQECQKRKNGKSLKQAQRDVEQCVCTELMKTPHWEGWVHIDDGLKADEFFSIKNYEREESSPVTGDRFTVVFPFCMRDGQLALKQMKWVADLGPYDHSAMLSYDYLTSTALVDRIEEQALRAFPKVTKFAYGAPRPEHWPPTIAFRECAIQMEKVGTPWLWMESDACPLKKGWIDELQKFYWSCGKSFAGPIVADMKHMNGTGIYPVNTPKRIPAALANHRTAWDVTMKPEMINDCANMGHLFFHVWGIHDGKLHPYLGEPPVFRDRTYFSQIPATAVVLHRDKSLSIIDRLRELNQTPQPK